MKSVFSKHYDVCIIGGGIGGLMAAHRIIENAPNMRVCLIEKGRPLEKRNCPVISGETKGCIRCKNCSIMEGMAGAGAFSDGKYIISSEYGGWLTEILEEKEVLSYIEEADKILVSFGATKERYMPDNQLKKLCLNRGLFMHQAQVKHLGTDANLLTMKAMIDYLQKRIEIHTDIAVSDVDKDDHKVVLNNGVHFSADNIVFAVGRSGSHFFQKWCKKTGTPVVNNQVDIGVRVELDAMIWEDFSKKVYEPKILYRTSKYGDVTRMFCFNDRGYVVTENTDGILTVNGHSYREASKKTRNSNFALLCTIRFTDPFKEPIEYARHTAYLANLISGGSVLVQRFGDLQSGRRSTTNRIANGSIRPTLGAVAGDLSLCMPKRQLDNIVETIQALDRVAPGTANGDTLLYGVECKYYSARPLCDKRFQIAGTKNLFAVGDGAGFTRSLSQASANALYVADILTGKVKVK